ncbi:MAG: N-acetylmuramoyl-L-alanine amidase, partial [Alphaproteobacteria bacterium]|nr:N-acetylmuramoyl-L-alanine amidase [Alphaproteobacteria bacterium]
SIGIELVNPGHEFGYREFPRAQLEVLKKLTFEILERHPIPKRQVLGHSDVSPMRKQDPGELFPWKAFAEEGIGLWPRNMDVDPVPGTVKDVQLALRNIGYCIPVNGEDDPVYREILKSFQRHWVPREVTGKADKDTRRMLAAMELAVQADLASEPPKDEA